MAAYRNSRRRALGQLNSSQLCSHIERPECHTQFIVAKMASCLFLDISAQVADECNWAMDFVSVIILSRIQGYHAYQKIMIISLN